MKLKHLFLTALVVGSLASCSKDDDGPNEPVYQQIETRLSISTTSNSGLVGKAATESEETTPGARSERKIKTLTAVVFYEDGTFATTKTVTDPIQDANFNTSIDNIIVKVAATEAGQVSDTRLKIFLLANVSVPSEALASYDAFVNSSFAGITNCSFEKVMKNEQEEEGGQYIPMGSKELDVTNLLAGTAYNNQVENGAEPIYTSNEDATQNKVLQLDNGKYIPGEKTYEPNNRISLTRYVARVQLESLEADFEANYKEAEFTLTSISIANVSNASRWVENENNSLQSVNYTDEKAFYRGFPEKITRADYYLARSTYDKNTFSKNYTGKSLLISGSNKIEFIDKTLEERNEKPEMAQFYVFEFKSETVTPDPGKDGLPSTASANINTMLIITGKWKNGSIDEERSFRIPIRHDINNPGDYQVKRNYIYKVHVTLTGEGTNNPDKSMLNAFISFNIDVQPWKVITQNESDVN